MEGTSGEPGSHRTERLQDALLVLALVAVAVFLVALIWLHGPDAQMATMPGM